MFPRRNATRRLSLQPLEERMVMTGLPFGAMPDDTGEFMLGDVLVSVVLMESNGQLSTFNDNSETWTAEQIEEVKSKVETGLGWWSDTLATITDKHELNFHYDYAFADSPVLTAYEPITQPSFEFQSWIYDFLNQVGHNQSGNFSTDIRAFNHAQRIANDTDWAFTIFVVNDEHDADGRFAPGQFDRAFAFAGGRFFITPAGRPATTFAHEAGHMFWARDEYFGGGTFSSFRGYYNTQNLNAADNPTPGFEQVPSIMETGDCESGGGLLCTAFENHVSSPSSLEMVGWRDSDGDGIFDVLDVPHTLSGSGGYDSANELYHFEGESTVQTLPNRNPSGLGNDITLNRVSRAEYRIDGGPWLTAAEYGGYTAQLDLSVPMPPEAAVIEIRTVDDLSGIASPIFTGYPDRPTSTETPGIHGTVWNDLDGNGLLDPGEPGLPGWQLELLDEAGRRLDLQTRIEPDQFSQNDTILNAAIDGISLRAIGPFAGSGAVTTTANPYAAGDRVFGNRNGSCGVACAEWSPNRQLRVQLDQPVSIVQLEALGTSTESYARLEAFDLAGNLIARTTSGPLGVQDRERLSVSSSSAQIASVVASGHAETAVFLDNLRIGPDVVTDTDGTGNYSFPFLDAGQYVLRAVPTAGFQPTSPDGGVDAVVLAAADVTAQLDFGFAVEVSPWQNQLPMDVNDDGFVSPVDVLQIINDLNSSGARELTDESNPPFLDVNGDRSVTSQDVLAIINYLNRETAEGEGPDPLWGPIARATPDPTRVDGLEPSATLDPLTHEEVWKEWGRAAIRDGGPVSERMLLTDHDRVLHDPFWEARDFWGMEC